MHLGDTLNCTDCEIFHLENYENTYIYTNTGKYVRAVQESNCKWSRILECEQEKQMRQSGNSEKWKSHTVEQPNRHLYQNSLGSRTDLIQTNGNCNTALSAFPLIPFPPLIFRRLSIASPFRIFLRKNYTDKCSPYAGKTPSRAA